MSQSQEARPCQQVLAIKFLCPGLEFTKRMPELVTNEDQSWENLKKRVLGKSYA